MTAPRPAPKRTGRPPMPLTDEMADRLCDWITDGGSLRGFCDLDDTPSKATVLKWLAANDNFATRYARAMESRADHYADDIVAIADEALPAGDDGKIDSAAVQQQRLRVDARKWVASKLRPQKYGDKLDLTAKVESYVIAVPPEAESGEDWAKGAKS